MNNNEQENILKQNPFILYAPKIKIKQIKSSFLKILENSSFILYDSEDNNNGKYIYNN